MYFIGREGGRGERERMREREGREEENGETDRGKERGTERVTEGGKERKKRTGEKERAKDLPDLLQLCFIARSDLVKITKDFPDLATTKFHNKE